MNHEWLKILVSAVVGMLSGFAADPLRELTAKRVKVFRLERSLGFDWLAAKAGYVGAREGITTKAQFWQWELFPSFTHQWQHDPTIFYSDMSLQMVRLRLEALKILQEAVKSGRTSIEDAEPSLLAILDDVEKHVLKPPKTWVEQQKRILIGKFY